MRPELINEKINTFASSGVENATITVENDIIVPDAKQDMKKIVVSECDIIDIKAEPHSDRVVISGKINYIIIYTAEDGTTESITAPADFTNTLWIQGASDGSKCRLNYRTKKVECRMINCRKINTKSVLSADIEVMQNDTVDLPTGISFSDNIYTKTDEVSVMFFEGSRRSCEGVESIGDIPSSLSDIESVFYSSFSVQQAECYADTERITANGIVSVKILYKCKNDAKIHVLEQEIPYERYIDIENITSESKIQCITYLKNQRVDIIDDEDGERRRFSVVFDICIDGEGYGKKTIPVIEDLFSTEEPLTARKQRLTIDSDKLNSIQIVSFRDTVTSDNNNGIDDVCFAKCSVREWEFSVDYKTVKIVGKADVRLICADKMTGEYFGETREISFATEIEIPQVYMIDDLTVNLHAGNCTATLTNVKQIDVRWDAVVKFNGTYRKEVSCVGIVVENISDELPPTFTSGLVICYPEKEDTLWSVSKKYMTDREEIMTFNGVTSEEDFKKLRKIYIPGK